MIWSKWKKSLRLLTSAASFFMNILVKGEAAQHNDVCACVSSYREIFNLEIMTLCYDIVHFLLVLYEARRMCLHIFWVAEFKPWMMNFKDFMEELFFKTIKTAMNFMFSSTAFLLPIYLIKWMKIAQKLFYRPTGNEKRRKINKNSLKIRQMKWWTIKARKVASGYHQLSNINVYCQRLSSSFSASTIESNGIFFLFCTSIHSLIHLFFT